jgi:hypothetical protein
MMAEVGKQKNVRLNRKLLGKKLPKTSRFNQLSIGKIPTSPTQLQIRRGKAFPQ